MIVRKNYVLLTIHNFTQLRIFTTLQNAQSALSCAEPSSLITAHGVGVLNEQRCNYEKYMINPVIIVTVQIYFIILNVLSMSSHSSLKIRIPKSSRSLSLSI